MQVIDGTLTFSPSDLHHFLECQHLTSLLLSGAERSGPADAGTELIRVKGQEHEHAWLQKLREAGRGIVEIPSVSTPESWAAGAEATAKAMREGADVIYQGVLVADGWRGVADFIVRVDTPSVLGDWSYEAWDTKLARHSKPYFILQLAFYSEQLARIQGLDPALMHIVLGTDDVQSFVPGQAAAYFRALRARLDRFAQRPGETAPYPVAHCAFCRFQAACEDRWEQDDHLSAVANIRREQAARLQEAGITTVAALSAVEGPLDVRIGKGTLANLIAQARLQSGARLSGTHTYELLRPEDERGFALLPRPSAGDLFFDMEGFPYFEATGGLEYLFGVVWDDAGASRFKAFRALTRAEEKRAFEAFIDLVWARLKQDSSLHVYHYASYEDTALKRLAQDHGTRVEEVDELLRREVLVDLYRVVRQTLRISHDSYGLKKVRTFFMPEAGKGEVTDAGESMIEFDRWMRTRDAAILDAIERYNEEDCVATRRLRDWLLERKAEAEQLFGVAIPWLEPPAQAAKAVEIEPDEHAELRARLSAIGDDADRPALDLLGHLLDFHRREIKPAYWAYFERQRKSQEELLLDPEAIAGLTPLADMPPVADKRSWIHSFAFPEQEFKLNVDDDVEDPRTGKKTGTIVAMDASAGTLQLRGGKFNDATRPRSLVAGRPIETKEQRAALQRVAESVAGRGIRGAGPSRAVRDILRRELPRLRGRKPGAAVQTTDLDALKLTVERLDASYLFIQGPPGSGKTYTGARLIVHLLGQRKRVGVTALSHKAIHNLLEEVEKVAATEGVTFRGLKKASAGRRDSEFAGTQIENTTLNPACTDPDVRLVAGTSFLFSRPEMDGTLDYLFIDEAGQIGLGDAVAVGAAAENMVLLGDPQQLPNVSQGAHPDGVGVSVLQHLLGDAATVSEKRGVFLSHSWRMHPDVCAFVSELAYDGRLESAPGCEVQAVRSEGITGTGLRYFPVEHSGNAQLSVAEARLVGEQVRVLLATGEVTDAEGVTRRCAPEDILVVAPYNMQVRCLREHVPDGVECGTVDKFQGREAVVVFFSMATSSGEDIPRNVEFLFSRNRLNVALSRARCVAVVVASPALLEVRCRTVEQIGLVNALCRLVETARSAHSASAQ